MIGRGGDLIPGGDGKPTLEGLDVLMGREALLHSVVGGDDDLLGTDAEATALNLSREWVMIGPAFEVVGEDMMIGRPLVDDDRVLVDVTIPPFVRGFQIRIGVF